MSPGPEVLSYVLTPAYHEAPEIEPFSKTLISRPLRKGHPSAKLLLHRLGF